MKDRVKVKQLLIPALIREMGKTKLINSYVKIKSIR